MSRALQLATAAAAAAAVVVLGVSLRRRLHHHDPERIVRAYYDAWASGDPDAVRQLVADDYRGHVHAVAGTEDRGADDLGELVESHAEAFDEVEYVVEDVLRDDGRVAARVTMRAHHRETGRDGEIGGLVVLRLEGERVAEEWSSWDYLGLARQLGLAGAEG